jgi:hypothetical protein
LTDVSEELTASIIKALITVMMEALRSSETLFYMYQTTQCIIPEENRVQSVICLKLQVKDKKNATPVRFYPITVYAQAEHANP